MLVDFDVRGQKEQTLFIFFGGSVIMDYGRALWPEAAV